MSRALPRQEVLHGILKNVNAVSWENACWSDDNLSTKKLCPGFQFAGKQQWTARQRLENLQIERSGRHSNAN